MLTALSQPLVPLLLAPFAGSFLGVLVLRLPERRAVAFACSACPHCGHRLGALELVPLLSWLALRGRCRRCGAALGLFYPAVELAAFAVALSAAAVVSGWLLWASCLFGWLLLALALVDGRHYLLPDALTLPLVPAGLAVAWPLGPEGLWDHALGAAAGFLALAALAWSYRRLRGREGLGQGDAKLLAGIGAWVSWQGLPSVVLIAALLGLLAALALALAGRPLARTTRLPFGSCLAAAAWLVWLQGPLLLGLPAG